MYLHRTLQKKIRKMSLARQLTQGLRKQLSLKGLNITVMAHVSLAVTTHLLLIDDLFSDIRSPPVVGDLWHPC